MMNYEINEIHSIYENGKLTEVAVLWKDGDFVRATYSSTKTNFGYFNLPQNAQISNELLQQVAGTGLYLDATRKKKYFYGKRKWSN